MPNNMSSLSEQEIKSLIKQLQTEKERYSQEKLAKKISGVKDERTAELVAELFYSKDVYIRNIAIQILVTLEENALKILKEKMSDDDRNIRKFALDALKYINGKKSCEIAIEALDDIDENVVEAAMEVISHQKHTEAENKLLDIFKKTNSIWIINELLRTLANLEIKHFTCEIEEKIASLNATVIEKNILMNTYIRSLGSIGSHSDIDTIINTYSKNYIIDDSNLVFGLSSLVINVDISRLSDDTRNELEKTLIEHWDFQDSDQIQIAIAAFVKLQLDFFLADIEKIYNIYKGEDSFTEDLYEIIQKLKYIPDEFINKILKSNERELVVLGLKLIHEKEICTNCSIVEELCNSRDDEISELAIRIVSNIKDYNNPSVFGELNNCNKDGCGAISDNIASSEYEIIEKLLLQLEHQSVKVRKAAAQKLFLLVDKINAGQLERIISCNVSEQGIEAFEVLFKINENTAWNYITSRIDCMNESVRVGLIDLVNNSQEEAFYGFMTTMINDPSQLVRRKAIKALSRKINDKSLSLLLESYAAESDSINRMEIVSNLHRFNSDKIINIINNAAVSSDTLTRLAAAKSLSFVKNSMKEDILKRMLEDQVEEVREAAREALCNKEVTNDII